MQMCGRAGRPPFEDTGMAIIMTRRETVILVLLCNHYAVITVVIIIEIITFDSKST